jgi:hypothetical protein
VSVLATDTLAQVRDKINARRRRGERIDRQRCQRLTPGDAFLGHR